MSFYRQEIGEEQSGFVQGKCSIVAISVVCNTIEKAEAKNNELELWLMFIDYAKAFVEIYPGIWCT